MDNYLSEFQGRRKLEALINKIIASKVAYLSECTNEINVRDKGIDKETNSIVRVWNDSSGQKS